MPWFKCLLRRTRQATIQEEKLVAVEAESEDEIYERFSEVYAADPDPGGAWNKEGDGIQDWVDEGPEEDEAEHEVVSEIGTGANLKEELGVCDAQIKLKTKKAKPARRRR